MERVWVYDNILDTVDKEVIKRREESIQKFAMQNQLEIVGKSFDRHSFGKSSWIELEAVVEMVQNKTIDAVLVYSLLSLGKDIETITKKAREIINAGGNIISMKEGIIDSSTLVYFVAFSYQ